MALRLLSRLSVVPSVRSLLVVLLLGLVPATAAAQTEGVFAIGGNFRVLRSQDADASGSASPGLLWRFGHDASGWGLNYGLNWYNTDLATAIGGKATPFGELRVRPFMVGYGYKRAFNTLSITFDAIGGYAITSFKLDPRAVDALFLRLGARTIEASVANTVVVKPEITVWKDLGPKVGLQINGGYLIARPKVTITSSLGTDERRYRADMLVLQIGAVYSIF